MEHRNIIKVLILSIVTFGFYSLFWHFWTTKELKSKGADIPTAWLQIIPIANIYFYFKYYEGAEKVTGGAVSGILYFVLALFVSPVVSLLLAQNEYNKLSGSSSTVNEGGHPATQVNHQQTSAHPQQVAAEHAAAATPVAHPAPTANPVVASPASPQPMQQPVQPAAPTAPSPAPQAPTQAMPRQDTPPKPQHPPQNPPLVQ